MTRRWRDHDRTDERGAVLVLVALSMTMLLAATAFSFDIGREVDTNRSMQAVADAVALDAANFLDGCAAGSLYGSTTDPSCGAAGMDPSPGATLADVVAYQAGLSAARNNFTLGGSDNPNKLTVALGTWSPSNGFTAVSAGNTTTVPDAVQVTAESTTKFVFESGSANSVRSATALRQIPSPTSTCTSCQNPPGSSTTAEAGFTIGSFLASVSTGQSILNGLLGDTLGSGANVTLVGYQGLASANITLNDLLAANANLGTLNNALTASFPTSTLLGDYANALAAEVTALQAPGQTAAAGVLQGLENAEAQLTALKTAVSPSATVQLCQLIAVGGTTCGGTAAYDTSAASANLNALDFLSLAAQVANGSSALSLNLGLGSLVTVSASAISPIAVAGPGPVGITATDKQVQVTIGINTGVVDISLVVTAATATGTLTAIDCGPTPTTSTTNIGVTTSTATVSPSITVLGLNVVAAGVGAGGVTNDSLTFTGPFNDQTPPQTVGTADPDLTVTLGSNSALGLLLGTVVNDVTPVLSGLNGVLTPLLQTLGVNVGGATVDDNNLTCGLPVLVG